MQEATTVRTRRPLAMLSPRAIDALHQAAGMHSPNSEVRTDQDAFRLRTDLCVEDACDTSLHLVRLAAAQLDLLVASADLDQAHREVVEGIACLTRFACGSIGLVRAALGNDAVTA